MNSQKEFFKSMINISFLGQEGKFLWDSWKKKYISNINLICFYFVSSFLQIIVIKIEERKNKKREKMMMIIINFFPFIQGTIYYNLSTYFLFSLALYYSFLLYLQFTCHVIFLRKKEKKKRIRTKRSLQKQRKIKKKKRRNVKDSNILFKRNAKLDEMYSRNAYLLFVFLVQK